MMIDKIGGIAPLGNAQKIQRTDDSLRFSLGYDSINVSDEAKEMAQVYYLNQIAAETPDVRADKIAEVKAKLQDPSYMNDMLIASTADRIMEAFGL